MGHTLLGRLPKTKAWKSVIELISVGADAGSVAKAVVAASDKAFTAVQDDVAFKETVAYLVDVAQAVSGDDQHEALDDLGIHLNDDTTPLDLIGDMSHHLHSIFEDKRCQSDFGDFASQSLIKAFTDKLACIQVIYLPVAGLKCCQQSRVLER